MPCFHISHALRRRLGGAKGRACELNKGAQGYSTNLRRLRTYPVISRQHSTISPRLSPQRVSFELRLGEIGQNYPPTPFRSVFIVCISIFYSTDLRGLLLEQLFRLGCGLERRGGKLGVLRRARCGGKEAGQT